MQKQKLLQTIYSNTNNVRFNDLITIVESFGFYLARSNGSHFLYKNKEIAKTINLQSDKGKAKSYQVEQFITIIEKYNLQMED
jgi:predicted RNA binding protein YcfA (HicA-like mRNA interferase family)